MVILFWLVLVVVTFPVVAKNMIGPFLVWKALKIPTVLEIEHLEKDHLELSGSEAVQAAEWEAELGALGFEKRGVYHIPFPQVHCEVVVFEERSRHRVATIGFLKAGGRAELYVDCYQRYKDGSSLTVTNARMLNPQPKQEPQIRILWFPRVRSARKLIRIQDALSLRQRVGLSPLPMQKDQSIQAIKQFVWESSERMRVNGYCREEIDELGHRSVTFWGACILTWVTIFPTLPVVRLIQRRKSRRALLDVGYPLDSL